MGEEVLFWHSPVMRWLLPPLFYPALILFSCRDRHRCFALTSLGSESDPLGWTDAGVVLPTLTKGRYWSAGVSW
jgi:hypothetical protein